MSLPCRPLFLKDEVPIYLKIMWGIIPLLTVLLGLYSQCTAYMDKGFEIKSDSDPAAYMSINSIVLNEFPRKLIKINHRWALIFLGTLIFSVYEFYLNNSAQRAPENVVKAYYDALDFKEFERAHSYLDPSKEVTLDQYMLEVSVNDGILSSYAKLDSIGVKITNKSSEAATATINLVWITPLETIKKQVSKELVKENDEWYIVPVASPKRHSTRPTFYVERYFLLQSW